jgi:hypothetical protein
VQETVRWPILHKSKWRLDSAAERQRQPVRLKGVLGEQHSPPSLIPLLQPQPQIGPPH